MKAKQRKKTAAEVISLEDVAVSILNRQTVQVINGLRLDEILSRLPPKLSDSTLEQLSSLGEILNRLQALMDMSKDPAGYSASLNHLGNQLHIVAEKMWAIKQSVDRLSTQQAELFTLIHAKFKPDGLL